MPSAAHALLSELDAETPATRRVLERLPADQLEWRPHPKSMSAGQLAQHVASIPGGVARFARMDGLDVATRPTEYAACESKEALMASFDASVAEAREFLAGLDDARATATWRLTFGDREIFAIPRLGVMRTMGLNHWYHHRGELVVYLRLLNVPVPIVYGRSADENPFVQPTAR
jgi:uncharacterized damage-inducible protein DinB